jgi:hypothetical protein
MVTTSLLLVVANSEVPTLCREGSVEEEIQFSSSPIQSLRELFTEIPYPNRRLGSYSDDINTNEAY